jgi:hypothetical protein
VQVSAVGYSTPAGGVLRGETRPGRRKRFLGEPLRRARGRRPGPLPHLWGSPYARGSGPRVATGYGLAGCELPGLGDPVAARRGAHELCIASDLQSDEGVGHRTLGTAEYLADLTGAEQLFECAVFVAVVRGR